MPPGIVLDSYPGPFEQVLTNFLLNSVIHGLAGRADGCMTIRATHDGEHVRIEYTDNGVGMEGGGGVARLRPFFTTRLGQGGSGLGLYIVHNLVTGALGGSIDLHTAPGRASTSRCCCRWRRR